MPDGTVQSKQVPILNVLDIAFECLWCSERVTWTSERGYGCKDIASKSPRSCPMPSRRLWYALQICKFAMRHHLLYKRTVP